MEKRIIGSAELVSIAELNNYHVYAKIDTGAKSSSLHCETIVHKDGMVHFTIHQKGKNPQRNSYTVPVAMIKTVRSSNGISEQRIFVNLSIQIGGTVQQSLVSLTDRSSMKYSMLIGRRFLAGRYLVDCAEKNLIGVSV